MKANRSSWIVSAVLFSLVLTFATLLSPPTALPQGGTAGRIVLGPADDGRQIELRSDELLEVRLEANPSTGYGWYVQGMDTAVLEQVGEPQPDDGPVLLGAPVTVTLRFAPRGAGRSPLVLAYRRVWEEAAPLRTFTLDVEAAGTYAGPVDLEAEAAAAAAVSSSAVAVGDTAVAGLPAALNWCSEVGCTPVRNQGACGSCWAFATTGVLEQNIRIVDGVSKDLSEQYLVSCNVDGYDCIGGWWAHDYHQSKVPPGEPGPGAVYEASFPYRALDVACNPPHTHYETIAHWEYVTEPNAVPSVAQLKQAIYDHGPIAVAICAGPRFDVYSGGVFTTGDVCSTTVNHGVVLVGWDDSLGTSGAWIVRNSWGTVWGEDGYMKIAYGVSKVGYGASYIVRGTMPHTLLAPTNLKATARSTSRIDLSWTDTTSSETGFRIERSPNGSSNWSEVARVGAGVQSWSNTGLPLATVYYYRVQAYNDMGSSPYSNVASAKTWPDPADIDESLYLPVARNTKR